MNTKQLYEIYQKHPLIDTDTRKLRSGSMFFALRGHNFNGNLFARQALQAGAAYAVVDEWTEPAHPQIIKVTNVLQALQQLAAHHRRQLSIPVLAITGSNGKTTTKELVNAVISTKYKSLATQGNFNNHIGVPLTLLQLTTEHQFAVVEMGANHPNEIAELCAIAQPNFGLITNVGKAHLQGFGSLEGVMKVKGQLYEWLYDYDGLAFVNADNQLLLSMLFPQKTYTYGTANSADCSGEKLDSPSPFAQLIAVMRNTDSDVPTELIRVETQLVGAYNFENILAAVAVGNFFEVPPSDVKQALEAYKPNNNRSQVMETANNKLVVDAYNANPTSMRAAIENFATLQAHNKWLILGDMRELGSHAPSEHRAIVDLLKAMELTQVILVGTEFAALASGFETLETANELIARLQHKPLHEAMILLKASRGIGLENAIPYL